MTIQHALNVQERSVSQREAEVLLQHVLQKDRGWLLSHAEYELSATEASRYEAFLKRREQNEPVAYILGTKEFFGREFTVNPSVLIPRPETEGLIEQALAYLKKSPAKPLKILELGTGCGNIAITLAAEASKAQLSLQLLATDISQEALTVAQHNARLHQKEIDEAAVLKFVQADLFAHSDIHAQAPYDLIVANLPYVSTTWKQNPNAQKDVVFYEPDVALFGGTDGLEIYRRFFAEVDTLLKPGGQIMVEYGEDQTPAILPLIKKSLPKKTATVHQDYAGLDRVLVIA